MAIERVDKLFASESWTAVYTAFTNISLKAYDFDTIREALINYVAQTYPDKFNDMIASSEFIAVVDLVAYFGHSLSFRLDMNTRENFLDTAERRESILRMARTLGYNKTRPLNARGYVKITSIKTTQDVLDSNGQSLANQVIRWNDPNNVSWYDNFVTILNAALAEETKVDSPAGKVTIDDVKNELFYFNEDDNAKSVKYSFSSKIAGKSRNFEVVRAKIDDDDIVEAMPDPMRNMTIISRRDNLGPSSDRTGFFFYVKAGQLKYKDLNYTTKISNRVERIAENNISNTDVWIQRIKDTGEVISEVAKVDNDTRETAIYNILRSGDGNMLSVNTEENNQIRLQFPDGIFGNAAYGRYRTWYRTVDNEAFTVNNKDIKEATINLSYVGSDGRTYRLTFTMESTRDFAENFEGENYTSVRRIAPRAYYAQDRMVNGQDYNILPYTLGTNIVTKLKAVNTTFAGNSRFFGVSDATGHHSTVHVTGRDGSIYLDDNQDYMSFIFQRNVGDATDFISNRLVNVIKHPNMVNAYFYLYRDNPKFDYAINTTWIQNPLDPIRGTLNDPVLHNLVEDGDYLRIDDLWYTVVAIDSNDDIVLDRLVEKESASVDATVTRLFKGPLTKFSTESVESIEEYVTDLSVESFFIWFDPETLSWLPWDALNQPSPYNIHSSPAEYVDATSDGLLFFELVYKPGVREDTSLFEINLTGKKLVFESADEVKFYYSNNEHLVLDNETDLAVRDVIAINYKDGNLLAGELGSDETSYDVQIAYAPIDTVAGFDPNNANTVSTLTVEYGLTYALLNVNFFNLLENNAGPDIVETVEYNHYLVSPFNASFPIEPVSPSANTIIGDEPIYTVDYEAIFAEVGSNANLIDLSPFNVKVSTDVDYTDPCDIGINISNVDFHPENTIAGCTNPSYYTITASAIDLSDAGFLGTPSLQYFNDAVNDERFYWVDVSDLPSGTTAQTAEPGDIGVQTSFSIEPPSTANGNKFLFNLPKVSNAFRINDLDYDIVFKQKAIGYIEFTYDGDTVSGIDPSAPLILTQNDVVVAALDKTIVDNNSYSLHIVDPQMTTSPGSVDCGFTPSGNLNTYRIYFWTSDIDVVSVGEQLNVYYGGIAEDFSDYRVKIVATVNVSDRVRTFTQKYSDIETYIVNEFITPSGVVDNHKVEISTMSTDKNPVGMLDILQDYEYLDVYEIEAHYTDKGTGDERIEILDYAGSGHGDPNAANVAATIPPSVTLYYDIRNNNWYQLNGASWDPINESLYISGDGKIISLDDQLVPTTLNYAPGPGEELVLISPSETDNVHFYAKKVDNLWTSDSRRIILETYYTEDGEFERAYPYGFSDRAEPFDRDDLDETLIYYSEDSETWYVKVAGIWVEVPDENTVPVPGEVVYGGTKYRLVEGISYTEDKLMGFRWDHYADKDKRIDIDTSNVIDIYVLSTDYVNRVNEWIANKFVGPVPKAPNSYELRKIMKSIEDKAAIADHISYIPVKFKYLFGEFAESENQAYFDVIKRQGSPLTNSETKTAVAEKINAYFDLTNWDFGDTFYFSELAAYIHNELGDYISSIRINPKLDSSTLGDVLSITCEKDEMFLAITTSKDINIVDVLYK